MAKQPRSRERSRTPSNRQPGGIRQESGPQPPKAEEQSWGQYVKQHAASRPDQGNAWAEKHPPQPERFTDRQSPQEVSWAARHADQRFSSRQELALTSQERVKTPDRSWQETMRSGRDGDAPQQADGSATSQPPESERPAPTPPSAEVAGDRSAGQEAAKAREPSLLDKWRATQPPVQESHHAQERERDDR